MISLSNYICLYERGTGLGFVSGAPCMYSSTVCGIFRRLDVRLMMGRSVLAHLRKCRSGPHVCGEWDPLAIEGVFHGLHHFGAALPTTRGSCFLCVWVSGLHGIDFDVQ